MKRRIIVLSSVFFTSAVAPLMIRSGGDKAIYNWTYNIKNYLEYLSISIHNWIFDDDLKPRYLRIEDSHDQITEVLTDKWYNIFGPGGRVMEFIPSSIRNWFPSLDDVGLDLNIIYWVGGALVIIGGSYFIFSTDSGHSLIKNIKSLIWSSVADNNDDDPKGPTADINNIMPMNPTVPTEVKIVDYPVVEIYPATPTVVRNMESELDATPRQGTRSLDLPNIVTTRISETIPVSSAKWDRNFEKNSIDPTPLSSRVPDSPMGSDSISSIPQNGDGLEGTIRNTTPGLESLIKRFHRGDELQSRPNFYSQEWIDSQPEPYPGYREEYEEFFIKVETNN